MMKFALVGACGVFAADENKPNVAVMSLKNENKGIEMQVCKLDENKKNELKEEQDQFWNSFNRWSDGISLADTGKFFDSADNIIYEMRKEEDLSQKGEDPVRIMLDECVTMLKTAQNDVLDQKCFSAEQGKLHTENAKACMIPDTVKPGTYMYQAYMRAKEAEKQSTAVEVQVNKPQMAQPMLANKAVNQCMAMDRVEKLLPTLQHIGEKRDGKDSRFNSILENCRNADNKATEITWFDWHLRYSGQRNTFGKVCERKNGKEILAIAKQAKTVAGRIRRQGMSFITEMITKCITEPLQKNLIRQHKTSALADTCGKDVPAPSKTVGLLPEAKKNSVVVVPDVPVTDEEEHLTLTADEKKVSLKVPTKVRSGSVSISSKFWSWLGFPPSGASSTSVVAVAVLLFIQIAMA